MSEPTDNINVTEQEMPGVPDGERTVAEVEDEQLPDVVSDPLERESSQLQTEADVGNDNHDSVEPILPEKIPVEALPVPYVPVNDPGSNAICDEKTNVDEQLDNGNGLLESDANKPVPSEENEFKEAAVKEERYGGDMDGDASGDGPIHSFSFDQDFLAGDNDGSEKEQAAFMKELEKFHKDRSLEFKPPKFYGEGLNCLKLWRAVTRLGGYDQVTVCKLWRQVGESFKPPKTCTTVSWSFRCFYEKALLEYEKHKIRTGELRVPLPSLPEPMAVDSQNSWTASDVNLRTNYAMYGHISVEDLELAEQMDAMGLPISFRTTKEKKNMYTKGKKKGAHPKSVSSDNIVCVVKDRQLEDIASSIILHDRTHVPSSCETAEGDFEGNHHNAVGERNRGNLLFDEELVGVGADVLGGNDKKQVSDEMTDVLIDNHVGKDPIPDETDVGLSLDQSLIANGGSCPRKVLEDATYGFQQEGESINKQPQNNYYEDSASTLLDIAHAINYSSTSCPSSTESSLFSPQIDHEIPECPDNSVLCEFGEWRVVWDSFYKRNYFYNCQSKESTWYPPLGLEHFTYSCNTSNSNEMFADATVVDACLGIVYDGIQDKNIHDIESTKLFEEKIAFECLNQSSQEISCELSGLTVNYEFEDPDSRPTLCETGKVRAPSKLLDVNDHAIDSDIECFDSQEKNDMYNDKLNVPDIPVELTVSSLITTMVEVDDEENMNTLPEKYLTTTMNELDCHDIAYKERKKRVRRSQMQTILQEIVTSLPANIDKYWCQRYSLFSRFDCGIKMDEEGWFSVTPEPIARHHASRFASGTVIDCFSGVGGNAIQFALRCNHVIAIDIDPQKVEYARHNAAIYGVNDRIDFLIGDFFQLAARLKADTIFLSPPWGGPDYNKVETYDMRSMLKPCDGHVLFNAARIIASKVVMFLPRNVNLNQLAELSLSVSPPWALEVEKNYLNGKLKAITAYFDRPTT